MENLGPPGIGVSVWQGHALQTALDELEAARSADEEPEEGIDYFEGKLNWCAISRRLAWLPSST